MAPSDDAASEPHPRETLRRRGLRATKALGQNFLVAARDLDRVAEAARLEPHDVVLEIGTGLGRLTSRLAARASFVVTVELDEGLAAASAERLREAGNVRLVRRDFLAGKHQINPDVTRAAREALAGRDGPLKVASNLPYGISSPAIVNLLEWDVPVGEMCLMVQREVADRLTAAPGGKDYGPLTVYVDYWATVERVFRLPRSAFWPVPEVTSTLVRIVPRPGWPIGDYGAFRACVAALFTMRRKTIANGLRAGWGRETARGVMEELGLEPELRPANLSTADYVAIAERAGPPTEP
jgi:16S rRNA (adenine1518-N6/adenine1519-N6)-dimethyltransferase